MANYLLITVASLLPFNFLRKIIQKVQLENNEDLQPFTKYLVINIKKNKAKKH